MASRLRTQPDSMTHESRYQNARLPSRVRPKGWLSLFSLACLEPPDSTSLPTWQRHADMQRKQNVHGVLKSFWKCRGQQKPQFRHLRYIVKPWHQDSKTPRHHDWWAKVPECSFRFRAWGFKVGLVRFPSSASNPKHKFGTATPRCWNVKKILFTIQKKTPALDPKQISFQITSRSYQIITSSNHHIITSSCHQIIISPHHHVIISSHHHVITSRYHHITI